MLKIFIGEHKRKNKTRKQEEESVPFRPKLRSTISGEE